MADKESYHDYVIKDGNFVGKFDEMYSKFDDPWMQSNQPNKYSRMAGIIHIRNFGIKSVLECGCGLGYYAEWIRKETGITPKSVDISPVAIEKAKRIFPHLDFEVADISKSLDRYSDRDCVLFAEILWYILPDLAGIIDVLKSRFQGKFLMINQVFYKGTQRYGTEYFTSLEELIRYMPFEMVAKCEATTAAETTIETSVLFRIV